MAGSPLSTTWGRIGQPPSPHGDISAHFASLNLRIFSRNFFSASMRASVAFLRLVLAAHHSASTRWNSRPAMMADAGEVFRMMG